MLLDLPRLLLSKSFEDTAFRRVVHRLLPPRARATLMAGLQSVFMRAQMAQRVGPRTILVADFPRCGNTWMRYMLASALHAAASGEVRRMADEPEMIGYVTSLAARNEFRPYVFAGGTSLLKTHMPHQRCFRRGIVTYRNLFGSLPSLYAMHQWQGDHMPPAEEFLLYWADYYLNFYRSWLAAAERHAGDYLFLRYEDMVADMAALFPAVLRFVGIDGLPDGAAAAIAGLYSKKDVSWKTDEAMAHRGRVEAELADRLSAAALAALDPVRAAAVAEVEARLDALRFRPETGR